jgi:hypothetical protein
MLRVVDEKNLKRTKLQSAKRVTMAQQYLAIHNDTHTHTQPTGTLTQKTVKSVSTTSKIGGASMMDANIDNEDERAQELLAEELAEDEQERMDTAAC